MQPSRFLDSLPKDLIRGEISKRREGQRGYDVSVYQWDRQYGSYKHQEKSSPPQAITQRFFPEMRVSHPVYGEGSVRASRMEYGDETVEVYFEGLGLKALVASMSNLEVLED